MNVFANFKPDFTQIRCWRTFIFLLAQETLPHVLDDYLTWRDWVGLRLKLKVVEGRRYIAPLSRVTYVVSLATYLTSSISFWTDHVLQFQTGNLLMQWYFFAACVGC
jgi:hypothetical protein